MQNLRAARPKDEISGSVSTALSHWLVAVRHAKIKTRPALLCLLNPPSLTTEGALRLEQLQEGRVKIAVDLNFRTQALYAWR